uniref:NADH-ubiquinone oxidoreductase chain 2 n=1 Tax=Paulhutchinsonia pilosicollis TaxID=2607198 RepID=A0A6H0N418_9CUCU|nr:NADH dehydrogenase subunit 2 [Paulhutchinsonia pilosicollis]QIV24523.1 NADH dehydrogenase subunit 2 [Paulhutchinsonia pilosicollis]
MYKFNKLLFMSTLIMGTLIAVSSYSWMSMWIGLEINLLSIIPMLSNTSNLYPSESALKYFVTQALASTILLFAVITSLNLSEFLAPSSNHFLMMIMNSALLTKMGAAPFHAWFPEVMEGLSWINCLIMLTWQKIAPMVLVMYNCQMTLFLTIIIVFSAALSAILGLNQISLRKILAYSSINHIGWMVGSMLNNQSIWLIYFLTYSIITINIIFIFKEANIFYLKQLFNYLNSNKLLKFFFILNFLSLGGLPPFLGFFPKWLTINNLILNNFYTMSMILILFTLITLYFYLRITFSTLIINSKEIILTPKKISLFLIASLNLISLAGLISCTLIFNFF